MTKFEKLKQMSSKTWLHVLTERELGTRESCWETFTTWWAHWNKLSEYVHQKKMPEAIIYTHLDAMQADRIFKTLF
jgi:hypothetical protein